MKQAVLKNIQALLGGLTDRQREVIVGRFGLDKGGRPLTLASLGTRYKVTRERIRQIESSALSVLRDKIETDGPSQALLQKGRKLLKDAGGVVKADTLLENLAGGIEGLDENRLNLLIEASKAFYFYPADKEFHAFYFLDKASFKSAQSFIDQWAAFLRSKKEHALNGKYSALLDEFLKKRGSRTAAASFLSISKKIRNNPYGDMGLAEWAEILPRTIRDRVYLILKKKREPMHFRVIAQTVNTVFGQKNPASAPTVHNELIKDERFVLVGRGIYALSEHGYEAGTAKEVIARILKRGGPMRPREVILAVQKERFFKPNTVLVNLQNKNNFQRLADGTYRFREA